MATTIQEKDAALVKYPSYYVVIELTDRTYTFAEHPIPELPVTDYGLSLVSAIGSKIQMFKGRASIPEATFKLSNINNQAKEIISKDMLNSSVTIYGGYKDLAPVDFRIVMVGHMVNSKLDKDGSFVFSVRSRSTQLMAEIFNISSWGRGTCNQMTVGTTNLNFEGTEPQAQAMLDSFNHKEDDWIISPILEDGEFPGGQHVVVDNEIMEVRSYDDDFNRLTVWRGALGTAAATHDAGSTVEELIMFRGNVIELMLWILESGSETGGNGNWDLGIPGFGYNIHSDLIDEQSFLDYKDITPFTMTDFEFWLTGSEDGLQFFEDELFRFTFGYLLTDNAGKLRFRILDIAPESGWEYGDPIDEREILPGINWDHSTEYLFNSIQYGLDYTPVTGEFRFENEYTAPNSISFYLKKSEINLKSRGLRLVSNSMAQGGYRYLLDLKRRLFDWSLQSMPKMKADLFFTRQTLETGMKLPLKHRLLPNLFNVGEFDEDVTVFNVETRYKRGVVKAELLQTDYLRRYEQKNNNILNWTGTVSLRSGGVNSTGFLSAPTQYAGSDIIVITFLVFSTITGRSTINLRYNVHQGLAEAEVKFDVTSVANQSIYRTIIFPNYRNKISQLQFAVVTTRQYINDIDIVEATYWNDDWDYGDPV